MTPSDTPTVLTVDDEPDLVEIFTYWLEDHGCEVMTANEGSEALDRLSDDIDVVLLDRCMPGLSGDEVLEQIRDRGYNCRVAMVTAVEPGFDVIEMGFDAYLVKPITREDIQQVVNQLLNRSVHETKQQEYFALAEKQALLESRMSSRDLEASDEYASLEARLTELETELSERIGEFTEDDFVVALRDLEPADSDSSVDREPSQE